MSQNGNTSGRSWQSGQGAKEWEFDRLPVVKNKMQVRHEEALVARLTDKLSRVTSTMKRHRYGVRIKKANARLIALKLTAP